jgi:hypothetical protein
MHHIDVIVDIISRILNLHVANRRRVVFMQKNWRKGAFPVDRRIVELIAISTWGLSNVRQSSRFSLGRALGSGRVCANLNQKPSKDILSSNCFLVSHCESGPPYIFKSSSRCF